MTVIDLVSGNQETLKIHLNFFHELSSLPKNLHAFQKAKESAESVENLLRCSWTYNFQSMHVFTVKHMCREVRSNKCISPNPVFGGFQNRVNVLSPTLCCPTEHTSNFRSWAGGMYSSIAPMPRLHCGDGDMLCAPCQTGTLPSS